MQVLSAAYAFGICKHAELAGLHEQRAISLAAAGLPLAAFSDYLTSVKVRTAICLPACLPARLPARLSVCLSACHTDIQTQLVKMGTQTLPVSASVLQPLSDLIQMCCQEAVVYICAVACSWI